MTQRIATGPISYPSDLFTSVVDGVIGELLEEVELMEEPEGGIKDIPSPQNPKGDSKEDFPPPQVIGTLGNAFLQVSLFDDGRIVVTNTISGVWVRLDLDYNGRGLLEGIDSKNSTAVAKGDKLQIAPLG